MLKSGYMIQPSSHRIALKAGPVELCAKPLLDLQVIAPEYVTAIIEQHHTLGPYYVLAPGWQCPMRDRKKGRKDLACHY